MKPTKSYRREYVKKARPLPSNYEWFNYKERVEKELDELSKQTGITDWQSEYGQLVLADLQRKVLRDGVHLNLIRTD